MKPEELAHWYLRLNGFLTITNFVVHPGRKGSQLTDADIVGIRLPHRAEFSDGPGADEKIFTRVTNRPYFLIAEVKRRVCQLNTSWQRSALPALIQDLGPFPSPEVEAVTSALLKDGCYDGKNLHTSLFFVGLDFDPILPPSAPKKAWSDLLAFVFTRFTEYRRIKADHAQWNSIGQELWQHFTCTDEKAKFIERVKAACGIT